jgi:hypothetical protein
MRPSPIPLETRVRRAAAKLVGEPFNKARTEFVRLFHGEMIGGAYQTADVFFDAGTRSAVFVAGDVSVTVA